MLQKNVILALSLFFLSSFAFAQRQSGAIEGIIKDLDSEPIPGATITASSPSLIGYSTTTVTDQNGFYRFPTVSSGMYEVKAQVDGFRTSIRKEINVKAGITLTVDFTLEVSNLREVVEVIDAPPLIDMSTTAVSFTIPQKVIENLPRYDKIQNLLALTPGVSDDLRAYGSDNERANSVWVDGLKVSSTTRNGIIIDYNYNWFDEVQVTGIGAPAEYGSFTGVIGNFITRSGGNQFHGLFETFFQNEDLTSTNVPNPGPERPFNTYDLSAQLGGPILKDKLWFFSGIQYPQTQTPTPGTDELTTDVFHKAITKLTYKWNENNSLQGFANWNKRNFEREGTTPYITEEANYFRSETPQVSLNATWISIMNPQTTLEARSGYYTSHAKDIEDHPDVSNHYDIVTGISSGNSLSTANNQQSRTQLNAILSHHARDFIRGSHDFRFGVEFERSYKYNSYLYNGNYRYYDFNGAPYSRTLGANYIFEGTNRRTGAFAQDDWKIADKLNLSLGLRLDHNYGKDGKEMVFKTTPIAPRIGFVWILNSKNQTVIKAHYGRYSEALLDRIQVTSNNWIEDLVFQQYIDGQWVEQSRLGPRTSTSNGIKQPYTNQFTIGIDRVLPGEIPFGAHYIWRSWENVLETVGQSQYESIPFLNPLDGEIITVYNLIGDPKIPVLTNPASLHRHYHGLEIFGNKQFGSKLYLSASLVTSKLKGNFFTNGGGGPTVLMDDPNYQINREGRADTDRTFLWKIVGTYEMPFGINTGWYLRHESGNTWTAIVSVPLKQGRFPILAEPLGSRRLPSRNLLDMRVEKQFGINDSQLRFTVDVFNVFNSAYPLRVREFFDEPNFGEALTFIQPRKMRVGIRYTF